MGAPFWVLWDHAYVWGLLACRGLLALGAPFRVVSGAAVAAGALARQPPAALIVPGGFARRRFAALGAAGAAAIRDYVAAGGTYFGVCGGAGLALSRSGGLDLCPWVRRTFTDRLDHLVSGHVRLLADTASPLFPPELPGELAAPVWWPSGFVPPDGAAADDGVAILATYAGAAADLLLADIPLGAMSEAALAACRQRFGLRLAPAFLDGGACLIGGRFGRGRYVLSHAHLETPDSPAANIWLAHLLGVFAGGEVFGRVIPAWRPEREPACWEDVHLAAARRDMAALLAAGFAQRLLFRRTDWLLGWRPGLPGFPLSSLAVLLAGVTAWPRTPVGDAYWRQAGPVFAAQFADFARRVEAFFPAKRLAITRSLVAGPDDGIGALAAEQTALFGDGPAGGGVCGELIRLLDGLLVRLLPNAWPAPASSGRG